MSSLTLSVWTAVDSRLRAIWNSAVMARLRGAFLALFGGSCLIAFATYHPDDASWNTASHDGVHNAVGSFGATVADAVIQSLGLAAWPAAALMVYFGILRTFHPDPDQTRRTLRLHSLWSVLFILGLAAALAPLMTSNDPALAQSLGGFWGSSLNGLLAALFHFMRLPGAPVIASAIFAGLAVWGFNQTFSVKFDTYTRIGTTALNIMGAGISNLNVKRTAATEPKIKAPKAEKPAKVDKAAQAATKAAQKAEKTRSFFDDPFDGDEDEDTILAPMPQTRIAPPVSVRATPAPEPVIAHDIDDGHVPIKFDLPKTTKPAAPVPAETQPAFDFLRPGNFRLPELSILSKPKARSQAFDEEQLRQNARMLESVLAEFGVRGVIDQIRPGPVVTLYELAPAAGVKGARVVALADDIARNMSARSCRVSVVQGRNAIGIELPNKTRETVYLRDLLASSEFERASHTLPMALGETIGGEPYITDLAKMPHLLIAGTTGSGKSVGVNAMILSILYRLDPEQCKFIMIDPKMLELSVYDGIPHLLAPVVTDPKKAVVALKWTVKEMEDRYRRMSKIGVRNIASFNERARAVAAEGKNFVRKVQTGFDETGQPIYEYDEMVPEPMPYLVVVVDEVADLMMVAGKDIEGAVQRLAQMARAAGIHLIMATQRPSVDVITGTIKANFPTRISFQVTSKIDSRTILGEQGAEQLLGQGDMLYMAGGGRITRLHGPFVGDNEVEAVAQYLREQGQPQYLDDVTYSADEEGGSGDGGMGEGSGSGDDLYDKAVYFVTFDRKASTSYIQRKLQIGYNRAASLMEKMEQEGVVGPANHVGKRDILVGPPPGH
jgi:S-DNA-T family DNA segregation ATPase FtsK/SpoIIIE